MSRLVGDLLLLARADAGRIGARTRCDLAEVAGNAAAEVAPTVGERELRVDNERPLPVDGNPDELHRMVLNLLDNAVRHTPPGATIELRLRTRGRRRRGRGRRRRARRPGGAARADLRALRPRRRAGRHRVGGGSGLGLAIVSAVAASHGGTVEVGESESGGALFRVRLPAAPSLSERISAALDRL